jgi:hypothetical protein
MTRPLCPTCNARPVAVNCHHSETTYYRRQCDACLRIGKKLKPKAPAWAISGYKKKERCELCNFKAKHIKQLFVYHVDGNLKNTNAFNPLPASVYANPANATVVSFDSFNASRNFRDPDNLKNQNGVVFFPGSTALYKSRTTLVGGFGVSGDGVDQDDVVTVAGQNSFEPLAANQADAYFVASVRLPYQKYNRNPRL